VQNGSLPGTVSRREFLLRKVLPVALIFCATVLAYLPAVRGGFIWDDDAHVPQVGLRSLQGLERIWSEPGATQQYYPLLYTAFWVEHQMWGDEVVGYHLTNILLHALAACMVAAVVRRLALPGALLAGLIFALHPVGVESVAWISEQKNTLSAVFYMGSVLVYLSFDRDRRASQYWLALGFFVMALLCKTVTATLPAALLVIFWWQRGRLGWRREVLPLLPWLVVGIFAGLFTASVEQVLVGAHGKAYALSLLGRCLMAGRAAWFYLRKLTWPADLIFIYPRWRIDTASGWQWLYPISALGLVGLFWWVAASRRADPLRQRAARAPLAGCLFFLGTLSPALGFVDVYPFRYSYVADHFQYLAMLGVIVPVAVGFSIALARMRIPGFASWSLVAVLLAIYAALTWNQCGIYRDAETLYRATIDRNADCWLARTNLGVILVERPGRIYDAIAQYQEALRENPDNAEAHNNLGFALSRLPGRLDEAIAQYQEALRQEPNYPLAHDNLGNALELIPGRLDDAITEYRAALHLQPEMIDAHFNLGTAWLAEPGHVKDAIAEFHETLRLDPDNAAAWHNLGAALFSLEDFPAAEAAFREELRLIPGRPGAQEALDTVLQASKQR
jgi:protein O-mannosyl-transferase